MMIAKKKSTPQEIPLRKNRMTTEMIITMILTLLNFESWRRIHQTLNWLE
jgi:hypothetical protein